MKASEFGPLRRLIWEQTVWRLMVWRSKTHIVFSSANYAVLFSPKKQLLLLREGGLFNPLYKNHILPKLGIIYRIESRLRRWLMLASARHANVVMIPSETMRDWVLTAAPFLKHKMKVNLYGGDLDKFRVSKRRKWKQDGTLRLLYVSVYYPHKNPMDAVNAVATLNDMGLKTHITITMNYDQFRPWRGGEEEWSKMHKKLNSSQLTVGSIDFKLLNEAYRDHDIMVFPSVSETFGHSLVESMAAGIPIIAADTLTSREVCGPAALYYPAFDCDKLIQRIMALENDPTLRNWLSDSGKRRVDTKFKWELHVERLFEIIADLSPTSNNK